MFENLNYVFGESENNLQLSPAKDLECIPSPIYPRLPSRLSHTQQSRFMLAVCASKQRPFAAAATAPATAIGRNNKF